ncbi:MAG: cupin [Actinomycetia bacterium]|nr:cupin [Actinomycetes bacterium]
MTFPGGVGISGLTVYDWETQDGVCGGSPHVHLVCSEAYIVIAGEGHVQTLTGSGYAETPLSAGTVAWFTPGTVHRLVNGDGRLRIVVIMQNDGLPEAGDAVLTFPARVLADPAAYAEAATADSAPAARRRRDLAIEGYLELRERVDAGDMEALAEFHRAALRLKASLLADWRRRWEAGPLLAALRTGEQLDGLLTGDPAYLLDSAIEQRTPQPRFGMCGHLDTYTG